MKESKGNEREVEASMTLPFGARVVSAKEKEGHAMTETTNLLLVPSYEFGKQGILNIRDPAK